MLNYQSTSYHDAALVRRLFGLRPAPEFAAWLESHGLVRDGQLLSNPSSAQKKLLQHVDSLLSG
jgi:ethanolamine ammonia-lyase large subunit